MKKILYLLLILGTPAIAMAQTQTTTQKKTTTTTKVTTTKKTTAPVKKATKPATTTKLVQSNKVAPIPVNIQFTPFLNENNILLNGSFTPGKIYQVKIEDEKKATIFTTYFTAAEGAHNLDMGKPLPHGSYQVTVNSTENPFESGNINLVVN